MAARLPGRSAGGNRCFSVPPHRSEGLSHGPLASTCSVPLCSRQKCSFVDYQNPRLVVGVIVLHDGKVLLCRRGIEPQRGLWTVPAGYLECGESSAEGAARECLEEAGAHVEIDGPFCHYDIPAISQAYLLFRGRLAAPFTFAAQLPESLEARLFAPDQIPFDQLAFSSVSIALKRCAGGVVLRGYAAEWLNGGDVK